MACAKGWHPFDKSGKKRPLLAFLEAVKRKAYKSQV
jgi:hypothetical protein